MDVFAEWQAVAAANALYLGEDFRICGLARREQVRPFAGSGHERRCFVLEKPVKNPETARFVQSTTREAVGIVVPPGEDSLEAAQVAAFNARQKLLTHLLEDTLQRRAA